MRAHPLVVLPGVGAFGPAIDLLNSKGLATPLRERIGKNMSTLCVCLGFQLLAETSEEVSTTIGMGGNTQECKLACSCFLSIHIYRFRVWAIMGLAFSHCK